LTLIGIIKDGRKSSRALEPFKRRRRRRRRRLIKTAKGTASIIFSFSSEF
jgi:hypothetical protein